MSTKGIRNFRPKLHFTPTRGWINDPNGLVVYDAKYHLFYQYYPYDGVWGPMHWGHAVSEDLLEWTHLPIAISPDEDGTIFSGSAVADINNISGLGRDGKTPLIAFYTCHGQQQEQSIAYSLDGVNFVKYEKNPVIPNPGLRDFRDPKMFWNPVKNCWSMVIAAGDRIQFYATDNLLTWYKTGEFGKEGNHAPGVWECPDMVPFKHKGKTIWLLIASMTTVEGWPYIGTQYFLGDFDGYTFINTIPFGQVEQLDSGFDNYAGVTFNNAKQPILIGWASCWSYADKVPTGEFCGCMTLPRSLALVDTPIGTRLATNPLGLEKIATIGADCIDTETFALKIKGSGASTITLNNDVGQSLSFGVDAENNFFIDRSKAGANNFSEAFASEEFSQKRVKRFFDGSYVIDFIFDVSIAEIFIDDGTRSMAALCYPDELYNNLAIQGDAVLMKS